MPARDAHPPMPGPVVAPNFLAVMEAVGSVTFPISKRELIEHVGDGTVIFQGRNASLHEIIKDLHDDYFDSEEELREAMERQYALVEGAESEGATTPMGPQESWQSRHGPGRTASPDEFLEPGE